MIRLEQCDPLLCATLREEACHLFEHEPSRFVDRARHFINRGVAGDTGRYWSLRHDAAPAPVGLRLARIAPRLGNLELDEAYINVYQPGAGIPKHRDVTGHGHLAMTVVALQTHPQQGLAWYDGQGEHLIVDQLGQAVIFDSLATVHAVPAVAELRLSIVYLYR